MDVVGTQIHEEGFRLVGFDERQGMGQDAVGNGLVRPQGFASALHVAYARNAVDDALVVAVAGAQLGEQMRMGASGGFAGERLAVAHFDGCRSVVMGHAAVFDVNARHAVGCGRHDVVVVKTQVAGREVQLSVPVLCGGLAAQSQMPFADCGGGVSRPVHEVGHGGLFRLDDHARIACRHVRPGSAERILPCEQGVA